MCGRGAGAQQRMACNRSVFLMFFTNFRWGVGPGGLWAALGRSGRSVKKNLIALKSFYPWAFPAPGPLAPGFGGGPGARWAASRVLNMRLVPSKLAPSRIS